ncbi:MAG: ABC transporter permease [Gemmatimonadaceae bacterium]|nr:ABC transporter permease [Gemmatimonadaceae bacterium]
MMASPGGPSLLADPKLSREERQAIEARLGIDQPATVQYARWLGRAIRGDLGHSFLYQTPTLATISARLPATLTLAGSAILLSLVIGVPLGALGASRPGSLVDRVASTGSVLLLSTPAFWLGIMLILVFAVQLRLLPAGGATTDGGDGALADRVRHLVLPATVLAAAGLAELVRYSRSATRAALAQPFLRVARARGVPVNALLWRHAVPNALITVTSVVGLQLPRLIGGAAITETVFSWPGMGRLGVEAALGRDYPLVMGVTLLVSAAVVVASLVVDVVQMALDPRIRAS